MSAATANDYTYLLGQHFCVAGEIHVVQDLSTDEAGTFVVATCSVDEADATRTFAISEVIACLLIEEEIELFSPNYLTIR